MEDGRHNGGGEAEAREIASAETAGGAPGSDIQSPFTPNELTDSLAQAAAVEPGSERPEGGKLKRVVKNAGVLLGGKTVNAGISLAYLAVSAHYLGVEAMGALVLINAFAMAVGEVAKFQSWQAVLHYGTRPLNEGRIGDFQRVVRLSLLLDLASAVVGVAAGIAGIHFFGQYLRWPPEAVPIGTFYALSIAFMVTATPTGVLRLFDRFDILAVQSGVSSVVRLAGSALVALLGFGLQGMALAWFLGNAAALVYLFGTAWTELGKRGLLKGFRWRGVGYAKDFPGFWRFVWSTNLTATLELAFTQVGTLVVGAVTGPAPAALFRIARQVSDALAKPAKLVVQALYPELARLWSVGDQKGLVRLAVQVGLIGGAIATVLLLVATFAGRPFLGLVMGEGFEGAAPVMTCLVAAAAIGVWALPFEPMLISTGRAGAAVKVRLVVSAFYLAALVPAVRSHGLIGAGVAELVASILMFTGMLISVLRWYRAPSAGAPDRFK
jgi:O-antigen/teichoic acid export membrane protein